MKDMPKSRAQALIIKSRRFNTGKPCVRGHIADRYTTSGQCVECAKEHSRARYLAVMEALKEA